MGILGILVTLGLLGILVLMRHDNILGTYWLYWSILVLTTPPHETTHWVHPGYTGLHWSILVLTTPS